MSQELEPKQDIAAYWLANGLTVNSASYKANVCRKTITRWKEDPQFLAQVESYRNENRDRFRHQLEHLGQAAIEALWHQMQHGQGAGQLSAALNVLKLIGIERLSIGADVFDANALTQPKTLPNSALSTASTSAIDAFTPSAASDVTPNALMPHGTMPA